MPTYDYLCDACGHKMELFQSIVDSPKRKCPACGKLKLRRLFGSGGAIVFKGSGFYQTDYRSEAYKKAAAADRPASETKSSGDARPGGDAKSKSSDKSKPSEGKGGSSSGGSSDRRSSGGSSSGSD